MRQGLNAPALSGKAGVHRDTSSVFGSAPGERGGADRRQWSLISGSSLHGGNTMFHLVKKIGSLGLSALFRIPSLINRESSTARFISLFPLMVLTIGFVLSWHHSNHASATFDENIHIAEGLTFLSGHGYLTAIDHPPLFGILLALPTWLEHSPEVPAPEKTDYPFIGFAHRVVWQNQMDGRQAIVSARRVNLCFTVLLGCLLVLVAQRMHGPFGATITATVSRFVRASVRHHQR